ncbi:hypothetical protein [Aquimarina intermedia]|uniref:Uncharacterized protein n=1 Tax=Aquimarina intermedia TaxID=350814 RepID=A0A5S5BZJ5_9FLAO|nr:hypothetical protein [Aquimarina intermedia]TYP71490.1 hypothetical protein BD809_10972 [Aquimarina intermedia]
MAKSRSNVTEVVNSNVYDNNNKEIAAANVKAVLYELRDSFFNLIDDRLKSMKYDGNTTLQTHLNSIVGAIPVYGTVYNIQIGNSPVSYTVGGIISSAKIIANSGNDTLIEVNFKQNIYNRRLIPTLNYTASDWNNHNDVCYPVIRRISGTRIHVAFREVSGNHQRLHLEIIAI